MTRVGKRSKGDHVITQGDLRAVLKAQLSLNKLAFG